MSIVFDQQKKLLTLATAKSAYQMQIDDLGFLQHLHYGARTGSQDMSYQYYDFDYAFSGNPAERRSDRSFSLDIVPQEFSSFGEGDYRVNSVAVVNADGSRAARFHYVSHEIRSGKYAIPELPASYDNGDEAETLIVTLRDTVTGLMIKLYYGVFEKLDIITRYTEFVNDGKGPVTLEKAASLCLDLPMGTWDLMHFWGKHAMERQPERAPIGHCITTIGSTRGTSSHQHNPFVIICDHDATEDHGDCYGMMLAYSGGFKAEVENSQINSVRAVMGIDDTYFSWKLEPGQSFHTPEVILSFADGLTALSQNYHHFIRHNVCRGKHHLEKRPVLINNWEATYFDLNEDKMYALAKEAAALGIDQFVLDDGWFGARYDDNAGLGDWFVNTKKLPNGLDSLIQKINDLGMKFGIWVEPEMVNEDSDLYRAHPDWALTEPGRKPVFGRNQLVLDMANQEVVDYLYNCLSTLLKEHNIAYIKWDFNRSVSDVYSHALPADRQGEVSHRFVLGLYSLLERLISEFPDVLFEGCSGGGGRFDAGMLYYTPQIWLSDDTDAIERLIIQGGTSYGYPVSTMGAHVSASPNHQTGRTTPIQTRGVVAMSGAFGYELDLTKLPESDKEAIRSQVCQYHQDEVLIHQGDYFRLTDVTKGYFTAWQIVSKDKSGSLLNLVITRPQPNPAPLHIRLKGLDPDALYKIAEDDQIISGSALMNGGYTFRPMMGDYRSAQLHLTAVS
ncbi:MAG: alpha-galactosidase [Anaerolineaceae bacterium]|nr:alpha-galactosidase [Anaerolineaceae bacterium]